MAVIKKCFFESGKPMSARKNSQVAMEYNWDDEFFSIWTYRNGDLDREHGAKQQLQFNKDVAEEIHNAIGKFLLE